MSQLTVQDRLDIQELMAVYSRAIDFGRWEELPDLFTDDCTLDFGKVMGTHQGKDAVRAFANMLKGAGLTMRHYVTNCIITGGGDRAEATTYVLAFTGQKGSLTPTTGRYEDRLRKQGGRWLLQERRGIIELGA
ncbi:MAG TPA: nuclear transport factor 2 family protein [Candidatus Eisenbacteria bacterium]|nr:nuclear transport factor 2 family protein [Candidatus Eisenbacteria bacterium]